MEGPFLEGSLLGSLLEGSPLGSLLGVGGGRWGHFWRGHFWSHFWGPSCGLFWRGNGSRQSTILLPSPFWLKKFHLCPLALHLATRHHASATSAARSGWPAWPVWPARRQVSLALRAGWPAWPACRQGTPQGHPQSHASEASAPAASRGSAADGHLAWCWAAWPAVSRHRPRVGVVGAFLGQLLSCQCSWPASGRHKPFDGFLVGGAGRSILFEHRGLLG